MVGTSSAYPRSKSIAPSRPEDQSFSAPEYLPNIDPAYTEPPRPPSPTVPTHNPLWDDIYSGDHIQKTQIDQYWFVKISTLAWPQGLSQTSYLLSDLLEYKDFLLYTNT